MDKRKINRMKRKLKASARPFSKRVAPVYQMLRWKWNTDNGMTIPDEIQIYQTLLDLIDDLCVDILYCSTGGLTVGIDKEFDEPYMNMTIGAGE